MDKLIHKHKTEIGVAAVAFGVLWAVVWTLNDKPQKSEAKKRDPTLSNTLEPPGLINYGNTCYINSTLQALAGLPFFVNFLQKLCEMCLDESRLEDRVTDLLRETLLCMLEQRHVSEVLGLNNGDQETIYPKDLIQSLEDKVDFQFHKDQQDCHELLKVLMDIVDSSLKEKTQDLNRSINPKSLTDEQEQNLMNPFNGYIAQVLICKRCGQESNIKLEGFNDLSLIIKENNIYDLGAVFDHFFKPEAVEDVECVGCSIKALLQKKKGALNVLEGFNTFADNKSKYVLSLNAQIEYLTSMKNKSLVEYAELNSAYEKLLEQQIEKYENRIDATQMLKHDLQRIKSPMKKCLQFARLPKILCIHLQRLTYNNYGDVMKVTKHINFDEELNLQPWLNLKFFSEASNKAKYRLSSVIRHYGNESHGHYVTYRKVYSPNELSGELENTRNGKNPWSYTSDETTYTVKQDEVLYSPAYMLFYERA